MGERRSRERASTIQPQDIERRWGARVWIPGTGCRRVVWRHRRERDGTRPHRRKLRLLGMVCIASMAGMVCVLQGAVTRQHETPAFRKARVVGKVSTASRLPPMKGPSLDIFAVTNEPGDGPASMRVLVRDMELDESDTSSSTEACEENGLVGGGGWFRVVLLVGAILFTFNGLAIVCDEFFQASLEKISEVLELTPDVAGATFLAAGSSAPELFTAIADVFGPSNSIGVGTIVGSAMFNVLVIVALSAAVATNAGSRAKIDHRVVARDVAFYTTSIFTLVAASSDGQIAWWEALIMVMEYGFYILFMIYNSRILATCSAPRGTILPTSGGLDLESSPDASDLEKPLSALPAAGGGNDAACRRLSAYSTALNGQESEPAEGGKRAPAAADSDEQRDGRGRRGSSSLNRVASRALRVSLRQERRSTQGRKYTADDPMRAAAAAAVAAVSKDDSLEWPEGRVERFLFVFGLPFAVGLSLTVPDCSNPQFERYYAVTFVMSILWISLISSFMVELASAAACILGVSAIVMGVLVLAVGTSVPDMIGSMIAARNGEASMAIANAIGSNVFNILLGLGGPWLVSSLMFGQPTTVDKEGATTALIILFCAVLMFVFSLMLSRWTMNKTLAYSLLGTYVIYVIYTITAEALS